MGTADGGLWERKYLVLQDVCSRLYLADYALICLSAILGHFLLGSTMENLTNVLHALLRELFLGRPCALSGRHCGVSSQGRYLASYQPRTEDAQRLATEVLTFVLTFRDYVQTQGSSAPVLAVGGRGLAFCCVALLHSSHLCQGPWGLEVSRNSLMFRRWPCEAGDSGSYLSFPSKALLREKFSPIPVQ